MASKHAAWFRSTPMPMALPTRAAIEALTRPDIDVGEMVDEYRRRRNFIASSFADMGLECHRPLGAFYAFPSVAKFKLPERLETLPEFPVSTFGKVSKKALGERIAAQLEAERAGLAA